MSPRPRCEIVTSPAIEPGQVEGECGKPAVRRGVNGGYFICADCLEEMATSGSYDAREIETLYPAPETP